MVGALLLLTAFSGQYPIIQHADEAEILHFEYTNYDGGMQFMNDRDTAFFPFVNQSGHAITLTNIRSRNTYQTSPYTLLSPRLKTVIQDQQRDTIFFIRTTNASLLSGIMDQSFELTFEETTHKQYLNLFCELKHNQGHLQAEALVLPTVKRGEKIPFEVVVRNTGQDSVRIQPLLAWNDAGIVSTDAYPLKIAPDESVTLHFLMETEKLFNSYARAFYFDTNLDNWNRFLIHYSGQLISDNYPSIRFDSTALTINTVQGGECMFAFWFTNDGTAPLVISMVKTSCGCLVPHYYPKEPIPPGGRDVIKIKYDTNRVGPINKTATVVTNVSDEPVMLRVLGTITAKQ